MNSEMRNYGNYDSLGKYGTFHGRSTYRGNPVIPPAASARDVNSRRPKEPRPHILQDSTNRGAVQPRGEYGETRTHWWEAAPVREAKASKQEGHWDREDWEMWESKDHLEMRHKRKQERRNLGREWNSPEQVKRSLGHQPKPSRCPLPLLYDTIYEEWEPLYRRGLPQWPSVNQPADDRQVEIYQFYKEQSTRDLSSHKEAFKVSNHKLRDPSEMAMSLAPSRLGEKGYKDRPLKPPSYEMYLQMKVQAQQERKSAEFEKSQRGQVIDRQVNSFAEQKELPPSICQQLFSRERRHQGIGNVCGSNVPPTFQASNYQEFDGEKDRRYPPISEVGFNLPLDCFWRAIPDGQNWLEVGRNEKMGQVNQQRKCIDAECFGEQLLARTSPASWYAAEKDVCSGVVPHFREIDLPLYPTPTESTKEKYKQSSLKHEGIKVQTPQVELETWPREKDVGNRMKGEVLRSKRGEVVFCLVSRANSCQSAQDTQSHTLPKVGKDSNVPSWINELEPTLLTRQDGNFYKGGSKHEVSKSANVEVVKALDAVQGYVNPIRLQACLDGPKYTSIYCDSENPRALNMTCDPRDGLHFTTRHRQRPLSPRQLLSFDAGEELRSYRNPDISSSREAWGFQHSGADNSLNHLQVTGQEAGIQWHRAHLRNEVGQIALSPNRRNRLDRSTAWHLMQHVEAPRRRVAWANREDVQRERKLPEWKEPMGSALKTGQLIRQRAEREGPDQNGLFLIDASSAIVKVQYISSPEPERVRFSSPIQVEDSFKRATLPDSSKGRNLNAEGQEFSHTVTSPLKNIVSTSNHSFGAHVSDSISSSDWQHSKNIPEESGDLFPPPRMKESIKERSIRILGLPRMEPDSVEVQARESEPEAKENGAVANEVSEQNEPQTESKPEPRSGDDTVDHSEIVQDCIGSETVEPATAERLQLPTAAHASSLLEVMCSVPQTGASEEKSSQLEIPHEPPSLFPEGHGSSSGIEGDSGHAAPRELGNPNPAVEELQGKVLRSILKLRRHMAPDSESDDEEQERLLASAVITGGRAAASQPLAEGGAGDSVGRERTSSGVASRQRSSEPQGVANIASATHCWRDANEALSLSESVVSERLEDRAESQPGADDATNTALREPPRGAGSPERESTAPCGTLVLG
ncbi:uncharacterized protein LOC122543315 [Chiloscyllium plagiosum]|uniref:uncharacterized protein LOC122543315 n=1 Tax=Chiloscyllium plagiosum TaxID=36176 RepID=UPI001CB85FB4|nr:uncharacterized protein LOC122543315 [Chiloscyllium plagiosum]XP_043537768.1 uncharacterized protein LOC122543315 [Chiloscyllium plagiosum]